MYNYLIYYYLLFLKQLYGRINKIKIIKRILQNVLFVYAIVKFEGIHFKSHVLLNGRWPENIWEAMFYTYKLQIFSQYKNIYQDQNLYETSIIGD